MGELRDLKDEVTGGVDVLVGKAEGGMRGGLRVLKGKTKQGVARSRSNSRRQSYRENEVDETVL